MNLPELRDQLAALDSELLALIARRHALAAKIGQVKLAAGLSPRDFQQEKTVVERIRARARDLALPEELAEEILLALIRSSLTLQERSHVAASGQGSGKRVLVIGGRGRMGAWFVRFLGSQGFTVEVADPAGPLPGYAHHADWTALDLTHDIVIVAAPLRATNAVLHDLAERARNIPNAIIFDIGSLKTPLRSGLSALAEAGAQVTSVHPMFGPDTELLSGRHVIFVDAGAPEAANRAEALFAPTMAGRIRMTLDEHDRVIAYILGLSHALNIAFFTALARSGQAAPRLAELSSTTFDNQLKIAAAVARENPHLYFEIQSLNDYGPEAIAALQRALADLSAAVEAADEEEFVALMRKGRDYLAGRAGLS